MHVHLSIVLSKAQSCLDFPFLVVSCRVLSFLDLSCAALYFALYFAGVYCLYACMHACMYLFVQESKQANKQACMHACMHACTHAGRLLRIHGSMYTCGYDTHVICVGMYIIVGDTDRWFSRMQKWLAGPPIIETLQFYSFGTLKRNLEPLKKPLKELILIGAENP